MSVVACEVVRERVRARRGEAAQDADVRAHVAVCPPCAELLADGARLGLALDATAPAGGATPGFDALARELEAERGPRAWLRSRPTWLRRALVLASFVPLSAWLLAQQVRPDLEHYPMGRMLVVCAAFLVLLVRNAWVALRPPHQAPEPAGWAATGVGAALVVALLAAVAPVDPTAKGVLEVGAAGAGACFGWGLALGLPIVVTTLLVGRLTTARALVLAGSAAGMAANLVLQVHCPCVGHAHLLVAHASLVAVLALAGLALAYRPSARATIS